MNAPNCSAIEIDMSVTKTDVDLAARKTTPTIEKAVEELSQRAISEMNKMPHKAFYVRAFSEDGNSQLATSIQVIIPDGLNFDQAKTFVTERVSEEVGRYFADECLRGIGMTPENK
jgi:protoheme ferro-lyase